MYNDSGTRYVVTTGHIFSSFQLWSDPSETAHTITYISTPPYQRGGSYDCELRTCTYSGIYITNKIQWWGDGSTLNIAGKQDRLDTIVGRTVSKYGESTWYTAGTITSIYARAGYVPNANPTWIEVANTYGYSQLAIPGDSGGPWFSGNTAYGITSGATTDYQTVWFMSVSYLYPALQVRILTTP